MSADSIAKQLHAAITAALPESEVEVTIGSPGHYSLSVTSPQFEGKGSVAKQRLVYAAITDLMAGDNAPVHAIDTLQTKLPS